MKIKNSPGRKNRRRINALEQRKSEKKQYESALEGLKVKSESKKVKSAKKKLQSKIKKADRDIKNLESKIIPQENARSKRTKKSRK